MSDVIGENRRGYPISPITGHFLQALKWNIEEKLQGRSNEINPPGLIGMLSSILTDAHQSFYLEGYPINLHINPITAIQTRRMVIESYARATQKPYPSTMDEQERIVRELIFWTESLQENREITLQARPHYEELAKTIGAIASRVDYSPGSCMRDDKDD